ncbi:O-succinylhomoserine sulfhydrylase [Caulobacter endophyticus]|uniref:O-succinylhomoserine sulfhydrylase n=1 Tax=Caulobacter endophyticus TaxID=2172652 RepID=A0A2T9K5P9_9CAUL|nr:O-succinylhomoserine sulfhydrylase [Caulobacter endophyticus]PVM91290.1 O-succinylhomoserine sulfhydrylase [Caulobacter endophyticus]
MSEDPKNWDVATKLIRGGLARSPFMETAEALYLTQGFTYDSAEGADRRFSGEDPGFVYSRFNNPTVKMFEDRLALLEGAEVCRATATGMAAVHSALMGLVRAGDHVVAGNALFGSCRWLIAEWLPRFGVETTFVDATDLSAWEAAIKSNTKAVLIETPSNPVLEITDIAAVSKLAHAVGAKVIVDNVFATPIFQQPLALGADVVVYSATKHIDGQGRVLGGAILTTDAINEEFYRDSMRHTGPSLSPFNAWVMLKGLETLDLRVRRQTDTAAALADVMAEHKKVTQVLYPFRADHKGYEVARKQMTGGGTVIALDLGSREAAFKFLNALEIVDISNNLGDAKSMATHPPTTTHRSVPEEMRPLLGVVEGGVRLSVGLESLSDLTRDVTRALDQA